MYVALAMETLRWPLPQHDQAYPDGYPTQQELHMTMYGHSKSKWKKAGWHFYNVYGL